MASKKTIKISIPKDIHVAWERDFSFLGCYLIAEQHLRDLKRYIGVGYSMCAFFHSYGHVVFYRSESDEETFDRRIASRCLKESGYASFAAKRLRDLTDNFDLFFKKERRLSEKNVEQFIQMANEHFAFHLAVFWSADYIVKKGLDRRYKSIKNILEKARKYNEHVLPSIENWIAKQDRIISSLKTEECRNYILNGRKPRAQAVKARQKSAFIFFDSKNRQLFTGKRALHYKKMFDREFLKGLYLDGKTIKGRSVYPGYLKGRVRVISRFSEFKSMKKGDILVVPVTRPAYNAYIKKAGAIIADEGAILSHTSIVAREFRIPCIIGTHIATKALKDGDLVEVDADKGIVKIIRRATE